MTDDRGQRTEVGGLRTEDRVLKTARPGLRLVAYASESATASIKWHQSGTPEELQPLETILINQVWARESGIKGKKLKTLMKDRRQMTEDREHITCD